MFACCSPASSYLEETLNTLQYAMRTRNIKNQPAVQVDPHEELVRELRAEMREIRDLNERLRKLATSVQRVGGCPDEVRELLDEALEDSGEGEAIHDGHGGGGGGGGGGRGHGGGGRGGKQLGDGGLYDPVPEREEDEEEDEEEERYERRAPMQGLDPHSQTKRKQPPRRGGGGGGGGGGRGGGAGQEDRQREQQMRRRQIEKEAAAAAHTYGGPAEGPGGYEDDLYGLGFDEQGGGGIGSRMAPEPEQAPRRRTLDGPPSGRRQGGGNNGGGGGGGSGRRQSAGRRGGGRSDVLSASYNADDSGFSLPALSDMIDDGGGGPQPGQVNARRKGNRSKAPLARTSGGTSGGLAGKARGGAFAISHCCL